MVDDGKLSVRLLDLELGRRRGDVERVVVRGIDDAHLDCVCLSLFFFFFVVDPERVDGWF